MLTYETPIPYMLTYETPIPYMLTYKTPVPYILLRNICSVKTFSQKAYTLPF